MYAPNILITNYCNQHCPFCFASAEMGKSTFSKSMSLVSYKKIVTSLKRDKGIKLIKLLGGEPTLHPQLFEMIDMAVKDNFDVQIFTNGVLDKTKAERLSSYSNKLSYTFNVMTPGFLHNNKLRSEVSDNITLISKSSKVTLSITLDPFFISSSFFSVVNSKLLSNIAHIRIGLGNPIAGQKNWYQFKDFPKIGTAIINFILSAQINGYVGTYGLNCGFTRCMFTLDEYNKLKQFIPSIGWSCFGKQSSMDVSTDLNAFHCFPLSNYKRIDINKTGYPQAHRDLVKMRMELWSKLKMNVCIKCPFYGYGGDKCPGPCLAFRMNTVNKNEDRALYSTLSK